MITSSAEFRDLAFVPRWCIIRTIRQQNVAEHSFFVTNLIDDIVGYMNANMPEYNISDSTRLRMIRWGLHHDVSEATTSDITGPIKNKIIDKTKYLDVVSTVENRVVGWSPTLAYEELEVFSSYERTLLKTCDFLEAIVFLIDEQKLGNPVFNLCDDLMKTLWESFKRVENEFDIRLADALRAFTDIVVTKNRRLSVINTYGKEEV